MNIAIDITTFAHKYIGLQSGIQVHLKNILDCLQQIDTKNEYYLFQYIHSGYTITNPNWHLITRKKPQCFGSLTIWFQLILPWLLHSYKIDVLWSPDFFAPLFVSKKTKIVLTIHDLAYIRFSETMNCKLVKRFNFYFTRSVKRANKLLTVSEYIKTEIFTYIPESRSKQITVSSNGKPSWILPQTYKATKRSEYLFFAGNFEPRKNIINVIKAMELLFKEKIIVQLHLSGNSGWKNETVHMHIQNSPIKENIVFLGYLPEQELFAQYCNCKAFVFPSLYEGFGMPVIEALCCDCLVLTSKGTVMQDICGEAAIYFEPLDPKDIAEKIKMIFSLEFDRNKYLRHRTEITNRFDWKQTAEIIHQELVTTQ